MSPTTLDHVVGSVIKAHPEQAGGGRGLLPPDNAMAVHLAQHLDDIGDAVSAMVEQCRDNAAGVDEAVTEVVTDLDEIVFEAHSFLRRLSP
ncbi:hypothetical protein ACIO52_21925 [Nocardia sp. NPDC087230]|uniref:hypothetical protein n=1 Tax=Nocardia sp. NPDC087230 TaxID=3364331 RepID=UPI0038018B31